MKTNFELRATMLLNPTLLVRARDPLNPSIELRTNRPLETVTEV